MSAATLPAPPPAAADALPDDALTEVVYGEVVAKVMSIFASRIGTRLASRIDVFAEDHRLGRVVTEGMFVLSGADALKRRPDVAFVAAARWPLERPLPEGGDWELAPDLAVEVLSPGDSAGNVTAKIAEYFDHGVRQVWLIHPELGRVDVYDAFDKFRVFRHGDELETPLLPGWKLATEAVFRV